MWLVLISVVATHPIASGKATFAFLGGASRWVGYNAFADCGSEPPMDWMATKPCPTPADSASLEEQQPADELEPDDDTDDAVLKKQPPADELGPDDDTQDAAADPADGYVVEVDSTTIRSALDRGTNTVLALHSEVTEIQANGGLTVEIGDQHGR